MNDFARLRGNAVTHFIATDHITQFRKCRPFAVLSLCGSLTILAALLAAAPANAGGVSGRAEGTPAPERAQVPAGAQRAFARTAEAGRRTVEALKESGEHGGGLCPTSEDPARFTAEGNEAFGACMALWNGHRWDEAREAMVRFSEGHPGDPWRGESDLHVACYHKFRGENTEAEAMLADLHARNRDNAVGRKALVRLSRVYFDTYRYRAAYGALLTLLKADPTEHEKSYALNWLPHVSRAWMGAAAGRECGPKAFGYAAWIADNSESVRKHRAAESGRRGLTREGREHGAYLPPLSPAQVAGAYPWAARKGAPDGVSPARMRELLAADGWETETRSVTYAEMEAYASEDRPAVLCLPAPSAPRFTPDGALDSEVERKLAGERLFAGGREAADLGHYMVLVKATPRNAWLLDPENGMLQKDAPALKDLWLRGRGRGLAVFLSRPGAAAGPALPGIAAGRAEEAAFSGGCCGHETNNGDTGCGDDGPSRSCGMPAHQVNTLNMNYLVVDTPVWVSTPGGPDLELSLTYNNRESYNAKYPITNVQFYPFGCRWSAPYDSSYALDPASNILVRFPNGMETYFDRQAGGSYLPRDIRYADRLDLTLLPDLGVRVDLKGGLTRYFYHSLTNPALQQTLRRVEDRFGAGADVTRDGGGRIVSVRSDVTGASLNYAYDANGNVTRVFEKDGAQAVTGREALFSYGLTNGVSRLASMTDMGGYTTSFEYGPQTYKFNSAVVTSDHHITAYTWPNGGRWGFNLSQTHYYRYNEPTRLTVTDPAGRETVYNAYSYGVAGPVGKRDRNGASRFWGLDDVNNATLGKYATLVDDRQGAAFYRQGEYADYGRQSATGRREPVFGRVLTGPATGSVGSGSRTDSDKSYTDEKPRRDTWYTYRAYTNGHRTVTFSNAVYRAVAGQTAAQLTDSWTETLEQDADGDAVSAVDRAGNAVYLDRGTNRLVTAVRIRPAGESVKTVWQASYNARGQMTTQTVDEALQSVVSYDYDAAHRLTRILNPDGTSETFGYDASTQFLSAYTNRTGQGVLFFRDAMGRPTLTAYGDGTSATNHYGCCAADAVTDRHGVTARFGYDPVKRLETAVMPMNATAETCVRYGYLGEGEVSSLGYGGSFSNLAVRAFGYAVTNGATRLATRTTPLGKATDAWTHTFGGLPATHTDGRGVLTSNAWDAAKGLLIQSAVLGAARGLQDVTDDCRYDALDRLTNAVRTVSGSETWRESYRYDSRSRPVRTDTRVQNIVSGQTPLVYSVAYAYGPRGTVTNRTLTVTSGGGATIPAAFVYDPAVRASPPSPTPTPPPSTATTLPDASPPLSAGTASSRQSATGTTNTTPSPASPRSRSPTRPPPSGARRTPTTSTASPP